MFIFSVQDIVVKGLSGGYPVTQILFLRSVLGFPIILLLMWWRLGKIDLSFKQFGLQIGRASLVLVAYVAYYLGLSALPLAETTAIFFSAPLFVVLLSVALLGSNVGWPRRISIMFGFLGVMLIVQPGGGVLEWAVVLPVASAIAYAAAMLLTQKLDASSYSMTTYTLIFYAASSALITPLVKWIPFQSDHPSIQFLTRNWVWPTASDWGLFLLISFTFLIGFLLLTQAYKMADPTAISPFEYFMIPISMIWGITLFDEIPGLLAIIGIGMIISSGLFVWYRETLQQRGEPVAEQAFGD